MDQRIITSEDNYIALDNWISETKSKRILLVCDDSIRYQKKFNAHLEEMDEKLGIKLIFFRDFQPNPL